MTTTMRFDTVAMNSYSSRHVQKIEITFNYKDLLFVINTVS